MAGLDATKSNKADGVPRINSVNLTTKKSFNPLYKTL
jgi:hypothetical protein